MKKQIEPKYFAMVCGALASSDAKSVVKVIDDKTVVKATWRFKPDGRNKREEMVVTIGAPDYRIASFIKKCRKAGEPFPIKKLQYKAWPVKKVK